MDKPLVSTANGATQREIDLGAHHLILLSDQSIEIMRHEDACSVAETVCHLDRDEAYRLLLSLQAMFKENSDEPQNESAGPQTGRTREVSLQWGGSQSRTQQKYS